MNARYALNAANARWMSLYDSLYGTDVIEESEDSVSERYDPLRGEMVIKYGRDFLDKNFPLKDLSWHKITSIAIKEGHLVILKGADGFNLIDEQKFIGHRGEADNPSAVILKNNGKHITQSHLHFHIFPSKGYLRNLVWNYENIPERESIPEEKYIEMRDIIQSQLTINNNKWNTSE